MANFIKYVGIAFLVIGVIAFLYLGFGLKTTMAGVTEGFTYDEPHPLRWLYAFSALLSSTFLGSLLLGISRLIHQKEEEEARLYQIDALLRNIKTNTEREEARP
ncbi:hypothetical protein P4478_04030 [Bacillus subtilis]|nr:hypothetical protein [Bacillus subtilis]